MRQAALLMPLRLRTTPQTTPAMRPSQQPLLRTTLWEQSCGACSTHSHGELLLSQARPGRAQLS